MVVHSQNGWTANDRKVISTRTVRGTNVRLAVRNGAAGDLLLEVAALFDLLVQDIDQPLTDDWGYAERPVRGSEDISNHASGTAVDLNATRWPLGSLPSVNLTPRQITTVRQIVAVTRGVVRWGGDYAGRKDPMHFEINDNRTEADCERALVALRAAFGAPTPARPAPQEDDVELTDKIPDYYAPGRPQLTVADTLAWSAAHAAHARDAAADAGHRVDALAGQVSALAQQMAGVQALLRQIVEGRPQ
jgi:D-alanyl-D-alanine carboxypeptidase-like protein